MRRPVENAEARPQERLWILDRLAPGRATYNMPVGLRVVGALNPTVLDVAFVGLMQRHEALRTTFGDEGG